MAYTDSSDLKFKDELRPLSNTRAHMTGITTRNNLHGWQPLCLCMCNRPTTWKVTQVWDVYDCDALLL